MISPINIRLKVAEDRYRLRVDEAVIVNSPDPDPDPHIVPATTATLGGVIVGEDLKITPDGVLSVDKATTVGDFTKPITAAAVYAEVGNINVLLQTI